MHAGRQMQIRADGQAGRQAGRRACFLHLADDISDALTAGIAGSVAEWAWGCAEMPDPSVRRPNQHGAAQTQ